MTPIHTPHTLTQVPRIQAREFDQMDWFDPQQVLVDLRFLELNLPGEVLEELRRSRTTPLKQLEEGRYAALFAYGLINQVLKHPIRFSNTESKDFDAVINWRSDRGNNYYPVQLKQLPPDEVNPDVMLDDIYNKLEKYSGQDDLSVVIVLNRKTHIHFKPWDRQSKPRIRELWYLGCTDADQRRWFLYGSVLEKNPRRFEFEYPEGKPSISMQDIDHIFQSR
jgi:hypothetical protein